MAFRNGPQYPGLSEGLVFCIDPANPKSAPTIGVNSTTIYNMVNGNGATVDFELADEEWANARSDKGYIQFDGVDDYIVTVADTNTSLGLVGNNQISVTVWCKRDGSLPAWSAPIGATNSTGFTQGWAFTHQTPNQFKFFINHYLGSGGAGGYANSDTLPDDEWFMLTGVYDGTLGSDNVKVYINTTLSTGTRVDYTGDILDSGSGGLIYIGKNSSYDHAHNDYFFPGGVGPCMIWNRPLSAAEVLKNYNQLKTRFGL